MTQPHRQIYIFEEGGEETSEEQQWSQISWKEASWSYLEIYNQFEREDGQQQFNLFEFRFDPEALGRRFTVLDYELRIQNDSSWFALPTELEAGLDSVLVFDKDTIYRILGYAHKGDTSPGHIRYWSPEYGTLLVWYGKDRFFELIDPYPGLNKNRINQLTDLIRQDIFK